MASSDYILEIDGIEGESADDKFKGKIDIESFSWGVSNAGSQAYGGGGGAGKATFQDFHFVKKVDIASPLLALASANGTHISKAVLHVRKQGEGQQEFYTVTLEDLLVSSYQSGGSEGAGVISDQFSLNYARIKFEYKPQNKQGGTEKTKTFNYDIKANKKL